MNDYLTEKMFDVRNKVARHSTRKFGFRNLNTVTTIAIHHSATASGDAFAFANYHVNTLGWAGVGYHYVVKANGEIQWCGDLNTTRANVANNNSYIIGICLVGNFLNTKPTEEQKRSTKELVTYLEKTIPTIKDVKGHSEFPRSTAVCPVFDMNEFRLFLKESEKAMFTEIKYGLKGERVKDLQAELNKYGFSLTLDGSYGPATRTAVTRFQEQHKLPVTGNTDELTFNRLITANSDFTSLNYGTRNDSVKILQSNLNACGFNLVTDGSFGPATRTALNSFQRANNLTVSSTVNTLTWYTILEVMVKKPQGTTTTPSSSTSTGKPVVIRLRENGSNVLYTVLKQSEFHIDFELGITQKYEKVTTIMSDLQKAGKKPLLGINAGFFGGGIENLGLMFDEGRYLNKPHNQFLNLLYNKNGKFEIELWDQHGPDIGHKAKDYFWGMGTSFSLVQNGKVNLYNKQFHDHWSSRHPRTAIGQRANGDIVLVTVDGRRAASRGMTANELANLMIKLGCVIAVNLDGGGSTTMAEMGTHGKPVVINKPSDPLYAERRVGSVLIVYRK